MFVAVAANAQAAILKQKVLPLIAGARSAGISQRSCAFTIVTVALLKATAMEGTNIHQRGNCMSLRSIGLKKALKLLGLPENKLVSELRDDIRNEMRKIHRDDSGGGDFHVGFWRDAKDHATHKFDLTAATRIRIESNKGRERLYPVLRAGFLKWWDELRRQNNEDFEEIEGSIHGRYQLPGENAVVKVDNVLALKIGDKYTRIIYPYFSENPVLSEENGRIGLWIMSKSLPNFAIEDMIILDVLRSKSYTVADYPLDGDEEKKFVARYKKILKQWIQLADNDYDWAA